MSSFLFDELNVVEISKAFKGYAKNYKIEIIDSKDPLAQLKASKLSIKDLFKDLLNEMKGFKYQINGDKEFASIYFNFATKTLINSDEYGLDRSFEETLYRIDN